MAVASSSTQPGEPSSSSSSSAQAPRLSLLQNLSTQSILITQLFSLLSAPPATNVTSQQLNPNININSNAQAIGQIYAAIQLSTLDLSSLVKETYEHQKEWQRFLAKKKEVEGLEKRVRGVMKRLEGCRGELEGLVEAGRTVRKDIEKSERDPIPTRLLLSTAQSISKHTSAPIPSTSAEGGAPSATVIDKSLYAPWPSEMNMRQGLLFQLEGSMGGMGERGVVGDELPSTTNQVQGTQADGQQPDQHPGQGTQAHVHHEEPSRRYDPNAVFDLALNSDSDDD
ncbi:hypothetical protein IAU59_000263 [Kwoniella sp. CBS 9459]